MIRGSLYLLLASALADLETLDDECAAGVDGGCAFSALQRRALEEAKDEWSGSCQKYGCRHSYHSWMKCQCNSKCEKYSNCCSDFESHCVAKPESPSSHSCAKYGCGSKYKSYHACQCNEGCSKHGNCCSDYETTCKEASTTESPGSEAEGDGDESTTPAVTSGPSSYSLVWRAEGTSFFDKFNFLWDDPNHGSAEYLLPPAAEEEGVVQATSHWAVLRAGRSSPKYKYKRMTARVETKDSWKNFLSLFKFSHVPYGCGVWPALFTLADHGEWPQGGELDMLEYVNMDQSKSSFHTGGNCKLDPTKVNQYGSMPDRNDMNYDCVTNYPDRLGCAPNKWMKSSQGWAHSPGILATQWTDDFIKLFYIPEHEIPQDIENEAPKPEEWNRWIFSYFPLSGTDCEIAAQKLMMQINFCGDWAGKVWSADGNCNWRVPNCRAVDPLKEYAPAEDCCTQFIWDPDNKYHTNQYLHERAYFNISYIKIFQ